VLSLGLVPGWDPRTAGLAAPAEDGFLRCAPSALAPTQTFEEGIFVAGAAAGPKDIPDAVVEAGAAAVEAAAYVRARRSSPPLSAVTVPVSPVALVAGV